VIATAILGMVVVLVGDEAGAEGGVLRVSEARWEETRDQDVHRAHNANNSPRQDEMVSMEVLPETQLLADRAPTAPALGGAEPTDDLWRLLPHDQEDNEADEEMLEVSAVLSESCVDKSHTSCDTFVRKGLNGHKFNCAK